MSALLLLACSGGAPPEAPPPPVPGASVALETRMADGELPEECSVRLLSRRGEGDEALRRERPCGPELRWEGLDPGEYLVVIQGRSVLTTTRAVTLAEDQALDLGLVSLEPGGALAVQVSLPLEWAEAGGDPGGIELRVDGAPAGRTDAAGRALLRGVPVGAVEVVAISAAGAAQAVAQVAAGQEVEVLLELEPLPQRPVVGLRFTPGPSGAEITYIHPAGPAAGKLLVGDVVTAVEGRSLAGLGVAEAGPLLAGDEVGRPRRLEVLRGGVPLAVSLSPVGAEDLAASEREGEDGQPGRR